MPEAPRTLSKAEFDRYSARWAYIATKKDTHKLQECFFDPQTGQRRAFVAYPAAQLGWLISTVGARRIEAHFLAIDDDHGGPDRFALALYATDATGEPLSAYYLSSPRAHCGHTALKGPLSAGDELGATQVPYYLVASWLANWAAAEKLHPDMFSTRFGPLQGYSFSIGDMMVPLFNSQPARGADNREIHLDLCLHEYYSATRRHELTHTFGLVLRLYATTSEPAGTTDAGMTRLAALGDHDGEKPSDQNGTAGQPFYDMSTPCPPNI